MAASAKSWKSIPFVDGIAIPFRSSFSEGQFLKLQDGLIPKEMEDKWFIYYEAPYLFLHRSWTGQAVYRIALEATSSGAVVAEALWSNELAGAANESSKTYQAQLLNFLLSNLVLGQSNYFPRPTDANEPAPGVLQHHIAGTGYGEIPVKVKKPWWRVW